MDSSTLIRGNQNRVDGYEIISALKDYLDTALLNKIKETQSSQQIDKTYSNNEELWRHAVKNKIFAGQIIKLINFKILEWIPASPGLYHTSEAENKRERALRSYWRDNSNTEINHFNSIFFPQVSRPRIIELRPDEKTGMVQGGYGSLRIAPKLIQNNLQYILCATSTGVSHEGVIITLRSELYSKLVEEIKKGKIPELNIICRLMILPDELSPIKLSYHRGIPKIYLEVLELEDVKFKPASAGLVSVSITYAKQLDVIRGTKFSYSFCSFHPTKDNKNLYQAVDWLQKYAVKYSTDNDPVVIGDFDEEYEHFSTTEFPIKDIAKGRIPIDKLKYFEKFFHFEINELIMGDQNVFNNSQIGAVGSNAQASNNTFNQQINTFPNDFDYSALSQQLSVLRQDLVSKAKNTQHYKSIGEVASAEEAAEKKDEQGIIKHLKAAGIWVFDTAKDIGVDIVTELIKKQIGV